MASAVPYASLHLVPDRQPHQHPTTLFFTGRMPFLPPNQQCQSTEGMNTDYCKRKPFILAALKLGELTCKFILANPNYTVPTLV